MLRKDRNKMNLNILEMLRDRGVPAATPFPGEQEFESSDVDLDQVGDVVASPAIESPEKRKKKRRLSEQT